MMTIQVSDTFFHDLEKEKKEIYNQALEDFEVFAKKWADSQECMGRKTVKLIIDELIDSAKELKK